MINELLEGKKVGALAVIAMVGSISGGIWGGALLWDQIQDNTAKVNAITSYDDTEVIRKISKNKDEIAVLKTKQGQVDFTEIMQKLSRMESKIESMTKDIERNERTSNPRSL